MPAYILLTRLNTAGAKGVASAPGRLSRIREQLELWEANIVADYRLMGIYDHCIVFEVSDNFRAQRAVLNLDITSNPDSMLLTAIDLDLFQRMVEKEIRTEGPHEWQVTWWARLLRLGLRYRSLNRLIWQYCKPLTITGREHFKTFKGPCIVVGGNHTSHFDGLALEYALPQRIKSNVYFGAAADRWFLKNGGGRKELPLQPWYNSLLGKFPIRRGGGSATLEYSRWLLSKGSHLAIFPEGTRSTSKRLSRYRHGVSILATEMKVPIVPAYLTGLREMRPKGTREIFPGPASVNFHPPIYLPEDISVPDATKLIFETVDAIHQRVLEHGIEAARSDWTPESESSAR